MSMKSTRRTIIESAIRLARDTESQKLLLFLYSEQDYRWFLGSGLKDEFEIVLVLPRALGIKRKDIKKDGVEAILSWSGNQSRFSQVKYAFLNGVLQGAITTDSRVVCVLGPWGKNRLDTVTVHDLARSWSQEFPFDPKSLIGKRYFNTVMAVIDIALDIGALGREGKPVGTTFVIGDTRKVMKSSHQAVFNPFKGYSQRDRMIQRPEVVESIKELAQIDGAFVISASGAVQAAGRHLDTIGVVTKQLRGLGSRHRAAAGITRKTEAVAVVVSESTGRVTVFDKGRIISTLEPVIGSRLA